MGWTCWRCATPRSEAIARARAGGGPTLLEAKTYRFCGHSKSDNGSKYREREEVAAWRERDPLATLARGYPRWQGPSEELRHVEAAIEVEIDEATRFALDSPYAEDEALLGAYAETRPTDRQVGARGRGTTVDGGARMTRIGDLSRCPLRGAARGDGADDDAVIVLGEDLDNGGAFGVMGDLPERFGDDRIIRTPISENGFVGVAVGAAMTGMRPVAEIMFMDFMTLAMDQITNHAAKIGYMYDNQYSVPLVVRTPAGAGRGYGASHSQSLEGWLIQVPGLKVVAPSDPADAKGLLEERDPRRQPGRLHREQAALPEERRDR